jgi:NAD-dependent dihydropyrimidine dehydrogenase PreA subunit
MPSKIDETRCLTCGLCIKNCPHGAIFGTNPTKVSTSDVYERVWIDPDLCQDCGTCTSFEYWCPAEAISAEGEAAPQSGAVEGEKKYSKYIYSYDGRDDSHFTEGIPFNMITRIDKDVLPGSDFYMIHWVLPHEKPFLEVGHPPHIHKDPELLFHIGSDPNNPQDLGSEIEVYLGAELEKHVITKSCVIYIPPNFIHAPWKPLRTWRPWIFIEVNQGPKHTEKGYHQLLTPEAIAGEPHLAHFEDEGY